MDAYQYGSFKFWIPFCLEKNEIQENYRKQDDFVEK